MFDAKPDLQLAQLISAVRDLVGVNQALLKKIEQQGVLLNTLARDASDNSASSPAF
jgi:hypothetical protein